jgi:hypothetical protein
MLRSNLMEHRTKTMGEDDRAPLQPDALDVGYEEAVVCYSLTSPNEGGVIWAVI